MECIESDSCRKYCLHELETLTQCNSFWLLRQMEDATRTKLDYNDDYIEEDSFCKFLKWYNVTYPNLYIKPPSKTNKRHYSSSHRIEIAYKTKWRCAMCSNVLTPNFQIDHIKELRHGGKDDYDNTCALCVSCHAEKTRTNTLKQQEAFQKEFGQRAQKIEDNIFENLKRKRSPYF